MTRSMKIAGTLALVLAIAGCADSAALGPDDEVPAALLSVTPQGGATDVSVDGAVTITFDHAMGTGMEQYVALHEGDVSGPEVDGTATFSADYMTLTFTPSQPLKAATTYTIHIGGGMTDDHGNTMDMEEHGSHMGGEWATDSMMSGGMGSGMGTGMGDNGGQHEHMGDGWQHENGSYGMVFPFTTS